MKSFKSLLFLLVFILSLATSGFGHHLPHEHRQDPAAVLRHAEDHKAGAIYLAEVAKGHLSPSALGVSYFSGSVLINRLASK